MFAILFPHINPIAIDLGLVSIHWYGISYIISIILASFTLKIIEQKYQLVGLYFKDIEILISYITIAIIIGGRLGYIIFYMPELIFSNFLEIFKVWHGGMSFHGGLIGVIISIWIYCLRHHKDFLLTTDLVACVTPIGCFIGRIANFVNAELYGTTTNVSWAVIFPNSDYQPRHPSQLYEAVFEGIILFIIMITILYMKKYVVYQNNTQKIKYNTGGCLSGIFLVSYSIFRMTIELVREPDLHLGYFFHLLTLGQILCIPMMITGCILITNVIIDKK